MRNPIRKALAVAAISLASFTVATGVAAAADQVTGSSTGWYWGYRNFSNCTVWAYLPSSGNAYATGSVPCNGRHVETYVRTTLKITTPTGVVQSTTGWKGPFVNSYGTGNNWNSTSAFACNHNYLYQAVVEAWLDNGTLQSYATTGTPKHLC